VHQSGGGEEPHDGARDGSRDHPADQAQPSGPLPEQGKVELIAGEQEEEAQTDVGDELDA
jgi:hypothetical protein